MGLSLLSILALAAGLYGLTRDLEQPASADSVATAEAEAPVSQGDDALSAMVASEELLLGLTPPLNKLAVTRVVTFDLRAE